MSRQYSLTDRFLGELQNALLTVFSQPVTTVRENPANSAAESTLSASEKRQSIGFMRVNHTGEVCAQALYRGQTWYVKEAAVSHFLTQAVMEEQDHLVWCHQRLEQLNGCRSFLNIYWYTHSFFLGLLVGKIGDAWSLGFVEETEVQVGRHLQSHLDNLSCKDLKSAAILEQIDADEVLHAKKAKELGANELPGWVKQLMRIHSKVMTTLTYWI